MRPPIPPGHRHRRTGVLLLTGALGAVLAACGSGGGTVNDESARSATQIYADTLAAMARVSHVHITGSQTDATGTTRLDADITQSAARITFHAAAGDTLIVVVGGNAYGSQDGGLFITLPADVASRAQAATLARTVDCSHTEHGALTKGAVSTVDGVRVIAILDDGRAPGASPGTTYVALDSARVVRTVQSGRTTAGGSARCGHTPDDTTSAATEDYDYSGSEPSITPPPNPGGTPTPGSVV